MKKLTDTELDYVSKVLERVVTNLENSEMSEPENGKYATDISLLISCDQGVFDALKSALKKLNS